MIVCVLSWLMDYPLKQVQSLWSTFPLLTFSVLSFWLTLPVSCDTFGTLTKKKKKKNTHHPLLWHTHTHTYSPYSQAWMVLSPRLSQPLSADWALPGKRSPASPDRMLMMSLTSGLRGRRGVEKVAPTGKDHVTPSLVHYIFTLTRAHGRQTLIGVSGNNHAIIIFIRSVHNQLMDSCTYLNTKCFDCSLCQGDYLLGWVGRTWTIYMQFKGIKQHLFGIPKKTSV